MSNNLYSLDKNTKLNIKANLIFVTASKYGDDWDSMLHSHYFTELFYVFRGTGNFTVGNNKFTVKENNLIIVNPNVEHTETSINSSPMEYLVLGIENLSFDFGQENDDNSYRIYNCKPYKREMEFYLKTILKEITVKELNYETVCQKLLEVIIIRLMRHTNYALSIAPSKKINKECGKVKRYIDANYKKNITLDTLSHISHINKYYLVHSFKKFAGISPINYLIARRIEESKTLLQNTDYSISEISLIIGFSSPSYFSQVFKKSVKFSPNEYRKKVKKTL